MATSRKITVSVNDGEIQEFDTYDEADKFI